MIENPFERVYTGIGNRSNDAICMSTVQLDVGQCQTARCSTADPNVSLSLSAAGLLGEWLSIFPQGTVTEIPAFADY